ncbi:MAG TPA: rRNA maturation RNase YbeY [Bacteriovoracaceae bacterium]|nr:rRNA maturation RNase YbeY [Bacteriovoracaceae bacterium]
MMKKHPLLKVELTSTVKWSARDTAEFRRWLQLSSVVWTKLLKQGLLPAAQFSHVKVFHLSVLVCGDQRMRNLNSEFRNKNSVTDVLSFPEHQDLRHTKLAVGPAVLLGDLAICHPQAKKQAKEFSIGYWDEFIHLLFHGIIHLVGYDHELSRKEERLMEKWEGEAIRLLSEAKKRGRTPAPTKRKSIKVSRP